MIRRLLLLLPLCVTANAAEWEQSLATVPALRTGGASLVSSDALMIEGGRYALITYWESRSPDDVDFYRCVDIADSTFATVRQDCWKALRPTGRDPVRISQVTSSDDICGRQNAASNSEGVRNLGHERFRDKPASRPAMFDRKLQRQRLGHMPERSLFHEYCSVPRRRRYGISGRL